MRKIDARNNIMCSRFKRTRQKDVKNVIRKVTRTQKNNVLYFSKCYLSQVFCEFIYTQVCYKFIINVKFIQNVRLVGKFFRFLTLRKK